MGKKELDRFLGYASLDADLATGLLNRETRPEAISAARDIIRQEEDLDLNEVEIRFIIEEIGNVDGLGELAQKIIESGLYKD